MVDRRLDAWAGQVQEHFEASIKADPMPKTVLEALAKTDLVQTEVGSNTFRFFTRAFVRATRESLTAFRARTTNTNPMTTDLTHGGQLTSKAMPNKFETLTVETVSSDAYDIDRTAQVDTKFNTPEEITIRARAIMAETLKQEKHELILSQALFSSEWVLASAASVTLSAAVTAADTFFDITDAVKATSGITAGDFVKIGDSISPNASDGLVPPIEVVLVKTVGADGTGGASTSKIDIETDITKFPSGRNSLAPVIFDKLAVALSAHASGVRVQIDRPQTLSVNSIDRLFADIIEKAGDNFIDVDRLVTYMTISVQQVMFGTNSSGVKSPIVANDILGADVLKNGVMAQGTYRNVPFVADQNAMARLEANSTTDLAAARHYIWCFEKNESVAYASLLESVSMDKIVGTGGVLWKLSWVVIHDSMMPRAGKIRSFLLPVTIS